MSLSRLKRLKQRDRTVMEYYEKFKTILLCCELDKSDEAIETYFLNGLNKTIQNILIDMEYNSLYDLIDLAVEIENRIKNNNICLAEIEHDDTHIVDVLFATNL